MSPRIDISIDELPEASSLLDGHDYSSQIIQRIAGVPVILDASGSSSIDISILGDMYSYHF